MKIIISQFHIDMNLALSGYPLDDDNFIKNNEIDRKRNSRKTIKKPLSSSMLPTHNQSNIGQYMVNKTNPNSNVSILKSKIYEGMDSGDGGMADFRPPPFPTNTKAPEELNVRDIIAKRNTEYHQNEDSEDISDLLSAADKASEQRTGQGTDQHQTDSKVNKEAFETLPGTYYGDYAKQYTPFTNIKNGPITNKDQILEKLNYMIHLLEEQQDFKTGNATEEIILYSFLGIFMIFVIDSFTRASKYVR
jgi:hypothetical protein